MFLTIISGTKGNGRLNEAAESLQLKENVNSDKLKNKANYNIPYNTKNLCAHFIRKIYDKRALGISEEIYLFRAI